ncbi:MAG: PKD domain-containing protein, partial [Saprospiraceae bacterium]
LFEYLLEVQDDVYTVRLVVGADVVSNLSATLSMLTAIRVPVTGFNVPSDSIASLLPGAAFENTSNGVLVDEEEPNYGYILFDIVGVVSPTYQAGDTLDLFVFKGNNCIEDAIKLVGPGATFPNPIVNGEEVTSFLSIGAYLPTGGTPYCVNPDGAIATCMPIVIAPDPASIDTLHYVLDFETAQTVCIDSALQLLNNVGDAMICEQGTNVIVSITNGDSCVLLTPTANYSGNDTLCIVHCDDVMTDFCDTTYLVVTVNPNDATPPPMVDSSCAVSFDLRLMDETYIVRMTSNITLTNTTFPTPVFPNPFISAPTNLMDITLRAPAGQLQIVNQIDFGTGREFVLKSTITSPAEDPTHDYFVFGLNPNNTPTIDISYVAGESLDLFSFQNISCNLDNIRLVGRGTDFGELIINSTNINTKVVANSEALATCVNSSSVTPPILSFSTTSTNPTTGVCNDGTITVTATGGTGLYEYSINNGTDWVIENEFTNLTTGSYSVRVRSTDEVCLTDAENVVLQNVDCALVCDVVITTIDSTNATCNAANGMLTINATGSHLQYSINTGATFQSSNSFENIAEGIYNIVVRDSVNNNCEANITITLNGTRLPVIQSVELSDTDSFAANTGVITILATGDDGLKYSIDGGLNFFEGNAFTDLGLGAYTVVVANSDEACPVMYDNNPIQINQSCTVNAGEDRTICSGGAVALSASGTAPIFGWTPSAGLSCTDCPNPIASPDITTTYIVTNSGFGCFEMDTILITVLPTITADYNFMTSCTDFSVQFTDTSHTDGTITDYAWDFGDSGTSTEANPNHTYAAAGSYTVRLTTTISGDCTNTVSKLVVVGNGLTGTVSDDANICRGDCTPLMAS